MEKNIIQLLMALAGAFGFALIFQLKRRFLLTASLGGLLNWGVYLLTFHLSGEIFISCFIAATAAALYCELTAYFMKAPVTLFLVPAVIPSIPGGSLYSTMRFAVKGDWQTAADFGLETLQYALAIAAGACLISILFGILKKIKRMH